MKAIGCGPIDCEFDSRPSPWMGGCIGHPPKIHYLHIMKAGKLIQKRTDAIITVLWLLMDGLWMNDFNIRLMSAIVIFTMFSFMIGWVGIIVDDDHKASDHFAHFAMFSWFLMNANWMASDMGFAPKKFAFDANVWFFIACICTLLFITTSDDNVIGRFKRFKIK